MTYLSWGEEIEFIEEPVDNKEFTKIKLISDGSEGWVKSFLVRKDAVAGAIASEVESYQRPDPMSVVLQKLPPATLILVSETKGDWVKIDGGKPVKKGWVKNKAVTTDKVDVISGKFFAKATKLSEAGKKEEAVLALEKIEKEYQQSKFLKLAQEKLAKLNPPEPPVKNIPDEEPEETEMEETPNQAEPEQD